MKILFQHIENLLLEHDCVIVQGFGGFIANHQPATYNAEDGQLVPPKRTITFNQQLKGNDGLLPQAYMQTFDAAYPEAVCQLEKDINQLCAHLDTRGAVQLADLGILRKDLQGRITLTPSSADFPSPQNYGLTPIHILPVETLLKQQAAEAALNNPLQLATPQDNAPSAAPQTEAKPDIPQNKPATARHPMLIDLGIAAAIAAIFFLLFSAPAINSPRVEEDSITAGPLITPPKAKTKKTESAASTAMTGGKDTAETVETAKQETSASSPTTPTGSYTIVLACHVSKKNAELYIQHLNEAGFPEARFVKSKVPRILYGYYQTEQEAAERLKQLRRENQEFGMAWVMAERRKGLD